MSSQPARTYQREKCIEIAEAIAALGFGGAVKDTIAPDTW
jgi:hypothetical protein